MRRQLRPRRIDKERDTAHAPVYALWTPSLRF